MVNQFLKSPKSILIVGGGTAGWMTAIYLSQKLNSRIRISLVESSDIGIIGVGEGSTPYLKTFFDELGIAESEWMAATDATYKSGIRFDNWCQETEYSSYFHPFFNEFDQQPAEMFFYNSGLKRRGFQADANPDNYFTAAYIADQYRSPKPNQAINKHVDYAYHFDSVKLAQFLREKAKDNGVKHIIANVQNVATDNDDHITQVYTDQDESLTADLFIDCTGFRSLLLQNSLERPFHKYQDWLFNDAAVAIQTATDTPHKYKTQTRSKALSAGWMWQIPLTSRWGNGYVYSSKYLTKEQAETELKNELGLSHEQDVKVKHLKMKVGRVDQHWYNNCVAIGLSQGFIEPLEATALMLVQFAIQNLTHTLNSANPDKTTNKATNIEEAYIEEAYIEEAYIEEAYIEEAYIEEAMIASYNKEMNRLFEGVKDYITAHYILNNRSDSAYWIDAREQTKISEPLKRLLQAWDNGLDFEQTLSAEKKGLVYLRPSWYCILSGMGRHPAALKTTDKRGPTKKAIEYCNNVVKENFPLN